MKKRKLDLDELAVVSFETARRGAEEATVDGWRAWSENSVCPTTAPSDRLCPI
jgi:hypothetical protein